MKKLLLAALLVVAVSSFQVASIEADGSADSDVNVAIAASCEVDLQEYRMPQGGALGVGRTGAFYAYFKNFGAEDAIVNADMNISFYNETSGQKEFLDLSIQQELYTHYEKMVDYDNYTANLSTYGINSTDYYTKWITAIEQYPFGKYNATIQVNYSCPVSQDLTIEKSFNRSKEFFIINSSGGVSEYGNRTTDQVYPANISRISNASTEQAIPANISEPGHIPEDFNRTGWENANESVPKNYSEKGPQTANNTIPAEANRSGATGNQSVPGKGKDQPGSYPRPILEIQPVNRTYSIKKTKFGPVAIRAENLGQINIEDITFRPDFSSVEGDWEAETASIASLSPGKKKVRMIHVKPGENVETGTYMIPVTAESGGARLDLDYFYVKVKKEPVYKPELSIVEAPQRLNVKSSDSRSVPLLIKNTGEKTLTNISSEIQNVGECGQVSVSSVEKLEINETASLSLDFTASQQTQQCNTTLVVSSAEGAYSFSRMNVDITTETAFIPPEQRPPILAIIWTIILAAYSIIRKRYRLDSMLAKMPQVLMILGETAILLYMAVNYYGIVSVGFLPF